MILLKNINTVELKTEGKYCPNNIQVAIDSIDLIPENIAKNKTVLGITGTYGGIVPEGIYNITANGSYDIANYATANVNVPIPEGYIIPEGQLDITENGVHDVTSFATVNVNVAGSGGEDYLTAKLNDTLEKYITDQEISLKQYAFYYTHNLDTIDAPIISFEQYAFAECYASTLVFRKDSVVPMQSSYNMLPYGNFSEVGRVFVPDNLVDSYKSATNWSSYSSIIYPISSYNPIAPKIIGIEKIRYGDTQDLIQYNHYTKFYCTNSPATTIVRYKINVPEGSDGKFGIYLKPESSNYHTTYLSKLDTEFHMQFGEIANKNDAVIKTTSSQAQTYIYKGISAGEHFVTVASTLSANTSVAITVALISRP